MARVVHGYCPVCNKIVSDEEVYPVVVSVMPDGEENIRRAFHFPGCRGNGELEPREFEEADKDAE